MVAPVAEETEVGAEEPAEAAEAVAEPVGSGDDDPRNRRRGRRGGRRRRRDGEGEMSPFAVPGADQPELQPVYAGPTPADPFGGRAFDIFDVMDQAERAAEVSPAPRVASAEIVNAAAPEPELGLPAGLAADAGSEGDAADAPAGSAEVIAAEPRPTKAMATTARRADDATGSPGSASSGTEPAGGSMAEPMGDMGAEPPRLTPTGTPTDTPAALAQEGAPRAEATSAEVPPTAQVEAPAPVPANDSQPASAEGAGANDAALASGTGAEVTASHDRAEGTEPASDAGAGAKEAVPANDSGLKTAASGNGAEAKEAEPPAPEPLVKPILIGANGEPPVERKRGWWRR